MPNWYDSAPPEDVIADVRDAGVQFTVRRHAHRTLRGRVFSALTGNIGQTKHWGLRSVSFQLRSGQSLGILGANGAGKSTLCKLLAGIFEPDEGTVAVHGRVSPLLALHAGLNRQLTGRDNIALCGALAGLETAHVDALLPEIVAFAEIEQAIDQPVRTYSTGMRTRLAFAIATCVDPDLLIVDEVLGVGDTYFKKKSTARMLDLMARSRAMIVVSHSAATIRRLCDLAIWLDHGVPVEFGPVDVVAANYQQAQRRRYRKQSPSDVRIPVAA